MGKPYKPVVRYTMPVQIMEGAPAFVRPLDHPSVLVSNTWIAKTGLVKHIIRDANNEIYSFETENTVYVRA